MSDEDSGGGKRAWLHKEVRRELILEGALQVFAEQGYRASLGRLAEAGGVTRTVLYYYFPSKKDLFLAVLREQMAAFFQRVGPVVTGAGAPHERMRASLEVLLESVEAEPRVWRMLFHPANAGEPDLAGIRRFQQDGIIAGIGPLVLADVKRLGADRDSPRVQVIGQMLASAIVAAMEWWLAYPEVARQTMLDSLTDFCWNALGAVREPEASGRTADGSASQQA